MEQNQVKSFKIGSRKSQLAMIQSNWVVSTLLEIYPDYNFEIIGISTIGDKILDVALSKIGEKSLFTKELENALLNKEIDFVVHSLKDLPTILPDGLSIASISKREDSRDAVIFNPKFQGMNLKSLPTGSCIGTSSLRRIAQLTNRFPHLSFIDVRGNLNTRLKKLEDPESPYAALILASAGIKRMGWENKIGQFLENEDCMYAVGQGALAVECLTENLELQELLRPLNDPVTYYCVLAERSFLRTLEGGCSIPVGVSTSIDINDNNKLLLKGSVWSLDGSKSLLNEMSTSLYIKSSNESEEAKKCENLTSIIDIKFPNFHTDSAFKSSFLGSTLAEKLFKLGAREILNEVKNGDHQQINKPLES